MIKLVDETIQFTRETKNKDLVLSSPLISGHTCPNCEQVIHASFSLADVGAPEMKTALFATPTYKHTKQPKYYSMRSLGADGKWFQTILEENHAWEKEHSYHATCRYTAMVLLPKTSYTQAYLRVIGLLPKEKFWGSEQLLSTFDGIIRSDPEQGELLCRKFCQEAIKRQLLVEVPNHLGPAHPVVYLSATGYWTYYVLKPVLQTALEGLTS